MPGGDRCDVWPLPLELLGQAPGQAVVGLPPTHLTTGSPATTSTNSSTEAWICTQASRGILPTTGG